MKWHYELVCDSCKFRRNPVNEQAHKESNEHEEGNLDHWVQLVEVPDGPPRRQR